MNPHLIKRLFKNASAGVLAANAHDYGNSDQTRAKLPSPKPPQQAPALGQDHAGETQSAGRPTVRFTMRRTRLLDPDAKWGAVKDLLDGLVYAGCLRGDREDQINLEVTQEKVAHRNEHRTIIEIIWHP